MTYSIIQKSQLEGALRLDAEYYNIQSMLSDFVTGIDIVDFVQYGTSKGLNEDNKGYPVLRLNEFEDYFIGQPKKYCNKINKNTFGSLSLKEGDVLICRTNGNPKLVGRSAIVMKDEDLAFASYLYRVRPKTKFVNPAVLVVYLNSRFGRNEIEKHSMISNQSNFSPAKFREIKIPKFSSKFQKEISSFLEKAYRLKNNSDNCYKQAENFLLAKLGLKDFKSKDELNYVVDFSDVKSANRIDAEHFQPKYEKLISKIKTKNPKLLLNVVENVPAEFRPQSQPERAFKYVELANINSSIGIVDGSKEVLGREAPSRAKRILKTGDIIVSSVEESLKKTALINEEQEGYLASTGFFQFRSERILPEVLLVLAKSAVLQLQFKKYVIGTILAAVPRNSLAKIVIPILPKPTQQKISNLVRQSHEARRKSKQLLEKAKKEVEKMIEKGVKNEC